MRLAGAASLIGTQTRLARQDLDVGTEVLTKQIGELQNGIRDTLITVGLLQRLAIDAELDQLAVGLDDDHQLRGTVIVDLVGHFRRFAALLEHGMEVAFQTADDSRHGIVVSPNGFAGDVATEMVVQIVTHLGQDVVQGGRIILHDLIAQLKRGGLPLTSNLISLLRHVDASFWGITPNTRLRVPALYRPANISR